MCWSLNSLLEVSKGLLWPDSGELKPWLNIVAGAANSVSSHQCKAGEGLSAHTLGVAWSTVTKKEEPGFRDERVVSDSDSVMVLQLPNDNCRS